MGHGIGQTDHTVGDGGVVGAVGGIKLLDERVVHDHRHGGGSVGGAQDLGGELGLEGSDMADGGMDDHIAAGVVATEIEIDEIVGIARHIVAFVAAARGEGECRCGHEAISEIFKHTFFHT